MTLDPRKFLEDYTKDLLDTKKPLNPLDRQAYMDGHIRLLELAMESVRIDEARLHLANLRDNSECITCYGNYCKFKDRLESLRSPHKESETV